MSNVLAVFHLAKTTLVYASILSLTLVVLDVVFYFFVPIDIARKFDGYKVEPGSGSYSKDYFVSNQTRGFDIKPGARGNHSVDEFSYPIWGNRLGCFDREWDMVPKEYYYFAGDSNTWGYTPFQEKFATLFEEKTGIPSLKCGVTHTGQRHQFEKFLEITRNVGSLPRHVIIGYLPNDIANDYAHPHSTVAGGWLTDDVFLDIVDYSPVRVDRAWLEEKVSDRVAEVDSSSFSTRMKKALRRYSLSAHVARDASRAARASLATGSVSAPDAAAISYKGRTLQNVYSLDQKHYDGGRLKYSETQFTIPNRRAILDWQGHATENRYRLTLILTSMRRYHGSVGFYAELRRFLEENGVDYIDLFDEFRAAGVGANQVYWQYDGHMSPGGNRLVADILVKRLASRADQN